MTEIILNEKNWAETAIENSDLGSKPGETLMRVAKYYYSMGYKRSEIERLLEEFVLRCDSSVCIPKWHMLISRCAASAGKYAMIDIAGVFITQKEMEVIQSIKGKLAQRLMFTLICLAKYGNAVNPNNGNWVNRASRDIFALANITINTNRQSLIINDLWRAGYIGYSNIVDNINLNIKVVDDSMDDVAVFITDFRNIGNQYMKIIGENYMECQNCGLVIKRTSNRQKYCPSCAIEMNIQATSENKRISAA